MKVINALSIILLAVYLLLIPASVVLTLLSEYVPALAFTLIWSALTAKLVIYKDLEVSDMFLFLTIKVSVGLLIYWVIT